MRTRSMPRVRSGVKAYSFLSLPNPRSTAAISTRSGKRLAGIAGECRRAARRDCLVRAAPSCVAAPSLLSDRGRSRHRVVEGSRAARRMRLLEGAVVQLCSHRGRRAVVEALLEALEEHSELRTLAGCCTEE